MEWFQVGFCERILSVTKQEKTHRSPLAEGARISLLTDLLFPPERQIQTRRFLSSSFSFFSVRIIIDFCEEDLRVGTAQMPDGKTSTKFRRSKEENRLSLNKTYLNVFEVLIWVTKKWLFSEKVTNFDYCMPGDVLANLWRAMTCENVHWFRCRLHWIRRLRARAMHGHLVRFGVWVD